MSLLEFDIEAKTSGTYDEPKKSTPVRGIISESRVPISAKKSTWSTLESPERIAKEFEFSDFRQQLDFVNELMIYQEKTSHHALIQIDHNTVKIETYTKDVNTVTELDLSLAEFSDLLYRDVMYYYSPAGADNERYL